MSQSNGHAAHPSTSGSQDKKVSPRNRSQNQGDPHQQASQIEKSVTHLLVATKQLLETLTQWSRGAATETEVSDVYVRLGYEFNIACRSFISVGIDTSDLGPVPDTLRAILEDTLAQEASQQSLDRYLPRIRDIIINLLHGLKRKQQKLRQKTGRESSLSGGSIRQSSITSTVASAGDDASSTRTSSRTSYAPARGDSRESQNPPQIPPPDTGAPNGRTSPAKEPDFAGVNRRPSTQDRGRPVSQATPQTTSARDAPPPPPYPPEESIPLNQDSPVVQNATLKPPPGQQDALAALQRGGDLERRASRRFSQYQIQKHLGTSSIGMPSMPAQMSPIPNRGEFSRMRNSQIHSRSRSKNNLTLEVSPQRQGSMKSQKSLASQPSLDPPRDSSPGPEEPAKSALSPPEESPSKSRMSATITKFTDYNVPPSYMAVDESPAKEAPPQIPPVAEVEKEPETVDAEPAPLEPEHVEPAAEPATSHADSLAARPASNGPLTLYLQYKKRVKKFVLADGYVDLSLARLQLAFIEKFAWNTHSNGVDLPEIYIQDPESGVRHELEDLNDVKDHSILVLNIDDLDEVKKHFDDGFGGLKSVMEAVKSAIGDNQASLQRVSDRQQEAAVEIARIAVTPAPQPPAGFQPRASINTTTSARGTPSQLQEVQSLRRELAVMRQTYSSHLADMESSMSALRAKAAAVATAASAASTPAMTGDSGRAYVDRGKKQLSEDSEKIINRVDDLQDIVEDLRKDVVTRGVRPLPRQLDAVSKDVQQATAELRKMREFMKREKPIWTKVGENELKAVCDDQNLLTLQEELAADLEDDLEKAAQTFALVEQATKQQNLQSGGAQSASRQTSRSLANGDPVDPLKAKDGVLGEVRALQPNHETRLEAIERAEKARQLELESRRDGEFQKEVRSFVEQGKLKRSGGVEEAERLRKNKDEMDRRAIWERMGGKSVYQDPEMEAEAEKKRAAMADGQGNDGALDVPTNADDGGMTSPGEEFVEASEAPLGSPVNERKSLETLVVVEGAVAGIALGRGGPGAQLGNVAALARLLVADLEGREHRHRRVVGQALDVLAQAVEAVVDVLGADDGGAAVGSSGVLDGEEMKRGVGEVEKKGEGNEQGSAAGGRL
ncbi:hypothetical protein FH972_025797 [Carpinus fangiana]|uniref:Actin interacting protein 3 C-terminal domain-containing protein n=1 Tax=Carpinus fangiana TaxID=176857 RepID=A0A5N6L222_9ROSI|nr:hypothetical protein FH972_025797 [Carpinus fangiana]